MVIKFFVLIRCVNMLIDSTILDLVILQLNKINKDVKSV